MRSIPIEGGPCPVFVPSRSDDQTAKRCPTDADARRIGLMNAMVWSFASVSES